MGIVITYPDCRIALLVCEGGSMCHGPFSVFIFTYRFWFHEGLDWIYD